MAEWIKGLALSLQRRGSQLRCRFDLWIPTRKPVHAAGVAKKKKTYSCCLFCLLFLPVSPWVLFMCECLVMVFGAAGRSFICGNSLQPVLKMCASEVQLYV